MKTPSDAAALPVPRGVAADDVPTRRRRLSIKSRSDPNDPSRGLVEGGGALPARADGGEQGLPESSVSGSRSPSDWEKGSKSDIAEGVGASVRPVLDSVLVALGGAGPMSSADRRRQEKLSTKDGATSKRARRCMPTAADIATIQEVQTSKMCLALCEFLEYYSARSTRVIVSNADAERAWKACRGGTADLRVVLGELVDVRRRRGVLSSPVELEAYEKDFMDRFGAPFRKHIAFECSMLQTAEEDEQGRVKWRDLTCQDADDFEEFLKFATLPPILLAVIRLLLFLLVRRWFGKVLLTCVRWQWEQTWPKRSWPQSCM